MTQTEPKNREPLAIVGMGCRLPGAVFSPDEFWNLLMENRSGITEVPEARWNRERFYHKNSEIPRKMITKWGAFVDKFAEFDAQFFGISPREALRMDPQQRWLLESAWEAMEDAGMRPVDYRGSNTGVYVGIASNDYSNVAMSDPTAVDVHTNSGSTLSIASNRIAYLFDFKGPALSVDTACSSALVAINLGCQAIWQGEIDQALVGGSNALLTPDASIGFSKASMLSPSGQCFAFDARANGYVRGEGAGIFVVKPLKKAQEDGDRIYCTIRAAVINQDGNTSSMTVPGVETQAAMLRQAYDEADMSPGRVCYMEAHGTGTPVGDPIETRALGQVLVEDRKPGDNWLVGSVKTNVGHLESGSGVAGVMKGALVLYHDTIPANRNYKTPNPNIPFEDYQMEVVDKNQPLPHKGDQLPVVAVNSFGFGGTNSHIVLEANPAQHAIAEKKESAPAKKAERPFVLPISGRVDGALRDGVIAWRKFLRSSDADLGDTLANAGQYREHHDSRLVVVGNDRDEICHELTEWLVSHNTDHSFPGRPSGEVHPLVFVFTGQGAQWWKMGQELLEREPVFKKTLEEIDAKLKPLAGWSLIEEMTRDEATSNINKTNIAQPAIFGLQVALSELWKSWGIEPVKVIGHSVGEVAAAYVAGAYTMDDAVKIIYHRSRLQDTTGGHGGMVAAGLTQAEAKKVIGDRADRVEVAAVNSPTMLTLAGDSEPLAEIVEEIQATGKFVRALPIDYAFHTFQMEPIKDELLEVLADVKPMATKIPFISTVTGGLVDGTKLDGQYWWENVRQPVLFAPALLGLIRSGEDSFLEVGPHPALRNQVTECLGEMNRKGVYFSSLTRKVDESLAMVSSLAALHNHGYELDWQAINQGTGARIDIPKYQWQREEYWLESTEGNYLRTADTEHPLLGLKQVATKPTWRFELDPRLFQWLDDHRFWDSVVFPAAGYGEIGVAIARKLFPGENYVVEDLEMKKALFVTEAKVPTVEVVFDPETRAFQIFSASGDKKEWDLNSQGVLRKQPVPDLEAVVDFEAIKKPLTEHFDHEKYYTDYEDAGYQFQPLFKHLQNVWRTVDESFAEVEAPAGLDDELLSEYHIHPAVLDAIFHTVKGGQVTPPGAKGKDYFYLPAEIRSIRLYTDEPVPRHFWTHAIVDTDNDRDYISADIDVFDDEGKLIAQVLGFRADRVEQNEADDLEKANYQTQWEVARLKSTRIEGSAKLASTGDIVAAVNEAIPPLYADRGLHDHYTTFMPRIDLVSRQFMINAYHELGWEPTIGDHLTVESMMRDLDIADQHKKLVYGQMLAIQEGGFLKSVGDGEWEVIAIPEIRDTMADLDQLEEDLPQFASEVAMQRNTGPYLSGVLNGEVDPMDLLFPGGSAQLLETFYRDGADFPVINELIKVAVAKMVENLPNRRAIRILEVGAGTGSLTRRVLPIFPTDRTEFLFTDTGPMFLAAAKEKFAEDFPFVEFKAFDIERDPADQGIELHSYDIILGSNVIHATQDLKATLTNIRKCLAPDGILAFLEVTWRRAPLDNVFGLLPGWWRFTDTDLRGRSALISQDKWLGLLSDLGYRDVDCFISSPKPEENQQACFLAVAPDPVEVPVEVVEEDETPVAEEAAEEAPVPETVLVLADFGGIGKSLEAPLAAQGLNVVLSSGRLGEVAEKLDAISESGSRIKAIVDALSLDHPRTEGLTIEALEAAQDTGVHHVRELTKLLVSREYPNGRPFLYFLTRGVQDAIEGDAIHGLASSPVLGFLRVANNEFENFTWKAVDLDPQDNANELNDLIDEVLADDFREHEIAFRGDHRYARRVHRVKVEELPRLTRNAVQADGTVLPYKLQVSKPGILTNLSLNETVRREPDPDEIEIVVKAGGINFRDVMKALGMYPGNPVDVKWFGDDLAGEVVRVGKNVKDLKVGDRVVGMAPYCFRSYVTVHRNMVFRMPDTMAYEDAATLPTVFLTTHYAINELARMRKGESILIHAGTGGVGQAAIQIANHLGLEIFTTAGTPEKRQLLIDGGIPEDHVLDSRTLEFADRIMELTDGRGVDACLNSLAGDFIPKNLSVLATFGRYLEIGKIDVYGNSKMGMHVLRNNISVHIIDLAQHLQEKPEYVAEMFSSLESKFADGIYQPLPNKVFPITEVVDAFRYMAAGKHIGKNVLNFDVPEIQIGRSTEPGAIFKGEGTWLITGGAGGFGLELTKWMAANGARHFSLVSRSGPNDDALADIEKLRADGIEVRDDRADVTDQAAIEKIVAEIQASGAPLCGVIHGAMVLDDEFIVELDTERFNNVLLPKMIGAWNLHEATKDIATVENFINFSSYSAVIGAVKQSNYNAGNVFLDQLSRYRRAMGLPGLTFNWGALTGAGFVARNEKTQQYLEAVGLGSTDMEETIGLFAQALPYDAKQIGCARVDWTILARRSPSVGIGNMFLPVVPRSGDGAGGDSVAGRIMEAPADKRLGLVEDLIAAQVGAVLGTDASKLDKSTPLTNLGLDSLMAIELVNRIEDKLGFAMPMGNVLNGPNITDLSVPTLEKLVETYGGEAASTGGEGEIELVQFEIADEHPVEFPLTEGQRALWFLHRLAPESSAYNLIFSGKFRPLLDVEAMKTAFALLYDRHPMLDVTFKTGENGEPIQIVHKGRTVDFREHDCTSLSDERLKELISEHANRPFDLEHGPVVRLELFRTADDAHVALLSMHHIVSDAWSVAVLIENLIEYYFSAKAGRTPQIEATAANYSDFVAWEQIHMASDASEQMFDYWKDSLAGAPSALDLPTDRPRPAVQTFNGGTCGFQLDEDLTTAISDLSKSANATLFTTLLSGYELLLHRYCQQDDLVVGVPLAGRNQPELSDLVGYFINPVPVRSQVDDDPTVAEYLERNRDQVNGALQNQQYPLSKMVDRLNVPRDPGRSPIFQVSFSMERIPGMDEHGIAVFLIGQGGHTFHIGDLSMETIDLTTRQAQFEITLVVEEAGGHIYGCWQYNRDLFDEATIAELSALYEQTLRSMTENADAPVSSLALLAGDDRDKVLTEWNDTATDYSDDKLLHELVATVAAAQPEKTAVECGDTDLTYGDVNRLANGIAKKLMVEGVTGENVGVLLNRSAEMVPALLGVLKSGATYIPLDPEFPDSRLALMLEDAAPKVLLTDKALATDLPKGDWKVVAIDDIEPVADAPKLPKSITPDSLAYIIYTSGSTGTPKGVEIPHRAAINFLESMRTEPGFSTEDRLLAVTTLSFDISLLELFLPLISGGQTVIATRDDVKDGRRLANLLDQEDITVMQATPATWQMLLDSGWEGRSDLRIFCGGEALKRDLANVLANSAAEVWNLYGPTETTVWSTLEQISDSDGIVTIGKPIANTRVYILDANRNPVPAGFTGELWIAGDGLARGYRNRPELTAEAFAEVKLPGGIEERIYRTGDLARWTREGVLECMGRVDFQVKVRGVRMELGDIEAQLAAHPKVAQAVVAKREDLPTGEGLVGYVIAEDATDIPEAADLRQFLSNNLPASYIPAFFSALDEFPLTPNKKIDRQRLPMPNLGGSTSAERIAPRNHAEQKLWDIFTSTFETQEIGVTDNFFEMGGDSLLALRLIVEVGNAFGQEIPVEAFLRNPSIEQLALYLDSEASDAAGDDALTNLPEIALEDLDHITIDEASDTLPKLDAVALTYVPDALAALPGVTRDTIAERWFGGKPRLTNVYHLPDAQGGGDIGVIMLPCFESDFYKEIDELKPTILEALEMAGKAGAKCVSLTGVIPSTTDHGRTVQSWIEGRKDIPEITTGDATRAATIVKSVEGILETAGRKMEKETLGVIGLGSIGNGTLHLMLEVLPHPAKILICDPYKDDDHLTRVVESVRETGYKGQVEIVKNGGALPPEIYESSLIVASTNMPGILDIDNLNSGTLVVDYSFPSVFRVTDAIRRFETKGDILFTTGGELRVADTIEETIYLPEDADELAEGLESGFLRFIATRDKNEITGCILVSRLTGETKGVDKTQGPLTKEDAVAHYENLGAKAIGSAKQQMHGYFPDSDEYTEKGKRVSS